MPRKPPAVVSSNATIAAPVPSDKSAGKKRKAPDETHEEIPIDDERCQSVNIIFESKNFINSGEMKVGEFQKAIGTNSSSYRNFLSQKVPYKGVNSNVYYNAFAFFKHRELSGVKESKKKFRKRDENKKHDVSGIILEDEKTNEVPVYDTCDEIRKKIRAYLADPSVTQAGFLQEISKTYGRSKKISSQALKDLLGKNGPTAGNTSGVYYASYVFFEKLRIRDKKPKSKMRLEMEKIWNGCNSDGPERPGMDVKNLSSRKAYFVRDGQHVHEDKYGRVSIER